jgi:hypothetical protein
MHLETILAQATAPGASGAAAAAATGDSLTIKNSLSQAMMISVVGKSQADGFLQIIKPSGHDTTRGFRAVVDPANVANLLPAGIPFNVRPQELLSVTLAGSATAGDVESAVMLVLYKDLPGVNARYIDFAELLERADMGKLLTIQATLTGAAAGYTGKALITASSNLLQANRDYAVMGITTNIPCAGVCISGPDTGYQRATVPGAVGDGDFGRDFFCSLARAFDMPLIPVINSGNKESTNLEFIQDENNVSPQVSVMLALLD